MPHQTLDSKNIDTLRNIPDLIPVYREYYEDWNIRVFDRKKHECRNYVSPNRREFFKILLITEGIGVFTIGLNTYYIEKPAILFIHPNDIISWKNLSEKNRGFYCLFKKAFLNEHTQLKTAIDKYDLFTDKAKSIISLNEVEASRLESIFIKLYEEELSGNKFSEDSMQAYVQVLLIESIKIGNYPKPDNVSDEYKYIHQFFQLLERETTNINYTTPIRIKTAKEFAASLSVHPNYLNALLKKHTGQNVSTHIRSRLLEETKILLVQTDWSLQEIGYSIGFADQPNFNLFFKKNTGITPSEFRKSYHL
ncbi:helix-turn-helix transcriptional regulator [Rhodocytophaga rosea]|uniref:Helix-turn-helix transcriptional regulator n=1 Tax=Rhodocytophaga rosea TaxID=2704465 RepID=A0A6C0GNT0_9BACT|nr:helix-turn-helix transcriptional regulator [Rhodocytophaga rosea]QHT69280.1 helix-turn-helix transcriptional regulator [Rhodocytophaga rosea]